MSDIDEMNVGPRWYVAHTYSGYESKVKANLEKIVENRGYNDISDTKSVANAKTNLLIYSAMMM